MRTYKFAAIVFLPGGQRSFEVDAPDSDTVRAAVEMLLEHEGLSGPFEMVIKGGRGS
ncbi:hypothetical protein [Cupriavidus metallidurans]|uniref:hypothetical protein n=1 Tax=Cupriavidus metallidurans TaxID=119219 RepID=UPI001BFC2A62|nr:hypothetical protein [Cupriavidus metallidurans]QWC92453.1 hypothetical protein KB891_22405 [Cupriavidus metallidurans]